MTPNGPHAGDEPTVTDPPVEERAAAARSDLERHLTPVVPAFASLRARAHRRGLIGRAAAACIVVAVAAGALAIRDGAAGPSGPVTPLPTRLVRSDQSRSVGDPSGVPDAVDAEIAFAVDLHRRLAESEDGNFFVSPYSISTALSMTLAGADGKTKEQLEQVLHAPVPEPAFHDAVNALDRALNAPRPQPEPGSAIDPLTLTTANSLWGQDGYGFRQAFLDRLARSYDAGMNVVDFERQAEGARVAINAWVADRTGGRITEIIPRGVVDEATALVLVNTITFKASWAQEFLPAEDGTFTLADGSEVTAPMMSGGTAAHAAGDGWRSVAIPYVGGAHLVVVVPDDLDDFELTPSVLERAAAGDVVDDVTLPRFSVASQFEVLPALEDLGLTSVGDLGRMAGPSDDLFIGAVVHEARIEVDEQGTEAVAATAVEAVFVSGGDGIVIDRPFVFAVRDDATGAVLFTGRVTDPTA